METGWSVFGVVIRYPTICVNNVTLSYESISMPQKYLLHAKLIVSEVRRNIETDLLPCTFSLMLSTIIVPPITILQSYETETHGWWNHLYVTMHSCNTLQDTQTSNESCGPFLNCESQRAWRPRGGNKASLGVLDAKAVTNSKERCSAATLFIVLLTLQGFYLWQLSAHPQKVRICNSRFSPGSSLWKVCNHNNIQLGWNNHKVLGCEFIDDF